MQGWRHPSGMPTWVLEIRENLEFDDLMCMDKGHWPQRILLTLLVALRVLLGLDLWKKVLAIGLTFPRVLTLLTCSLSGMCRMT